MNQFENLKMKNRTKALSVLVLVAFSTCAINAIAQTDPNQPTEVYPFIVNLRADEGSLERFYIVPNSEERRERLTAFYKEQLVKLEQLPFEKMSEGGKVDYILMKRELNEELFQLNKEQTERSQIAKLVSAGDPVYIIEQQRRRGEFLKSELVAKQLNDMF